VSQILDTPLFEDLLRCLQADTSTRVISLSITALIMILPHIPTSASKHLPALFNIYSRLIFWDRVRKRDQEAMKIEQEQEQDGATTPTWDKLSYLLENDDEAVPELLHYFTFLYGLYPINFMSYIRKPQRYLRHANFPGADDIEVEPTEIQQRSEAFRRVHVLHPNFFTTTVENELTDSNRWMKSAAADVVAECMSLYNAVDDVEGIPTRSKRGTKASENVTVPFQTIPDQDPSTPFRNNSLRTTQASALAARNEDFVIKRSSSRFSRRSNSIPNSPSIRPLDTRADSPISHELLTSPSNNQIDELVSTQRSTRGSIYQTLTNDSVNSLALSQNHDTLALTSFHIDAYLHSLNSRDTITNSSRSAPAADPNLRAAYLHREIQLLQNDLNFERYLKQQHLTAIGQLRNKQIKEARGDAEIQNLINSNAILKSKLVEARSHNIQQKKETEKSRTHSRKWESELGAKLRVLREEQKKWNVERDELKRDLQLAKQRTEKLKQIVVSSERRELASQQKAQSVESNLGEMERLQSDIDRLTLSLRSFEALEYETERAKMNEETALTSVTMLKMELRARDNELAKSRRAFEDELHDRELARGSSRDIQGISQRLIDEALAVGHQRMEHMQKVYHHLLERYQALELQVVELLDFKQQHTSHVPQALLGGEAYGSSLSPSKYVDPYIMSDPTQSAMLLRCQHDASDGLSRSFGAKSPSTQRPAESGSMDSDRLSFDAHGQLKPQNVKAQSDVRVYGRGRFKTKLIPLSRILMFSRWRAKHRKSQKG
jgi:solute carrier family 25 protein 16